MARYNKEFKLHCTQCLLENKPFPIVDGIKAKSLRDYTTFWLRLYKANGEVALEDGFISRNYSLKEKINAVNSMKVNKHLK